MLVRKTFYEVKFLHRADYKRINNIKHKNGREKKLVNKLVKTLITIKIKKQKLKFNNLLKH